MKKPLFSFSLGPTRLTWDVCWLVTAPLGLWLIASVYISLFGGNLRPGETWLLAISIGACTLISLVAHTFAHLFAARICKGEMPSFLPLYPIGDASQVWSPARTPGEGFLIAVSGPLCSGIMAGGAFLVWNMQLAPYLSLIMLFLVFFNGGVALVNLMPAFPLDGGRLLGAICWRLLEQPAAAAVCAFFRGSDHAAHRRGLGADQLPGERGGGLRHAHHRAAPGDPSGRGRVKPICP